MRGCLAGSPARSVARSRRSPTGRERWVFVSSGSVYADHSRPGPGRHGPLLPPLEGDEAAPETYGEAKVACEEALPGGPRRRRAPRAERPDRRVRRPQRPVRLLARPDGPGPRDGGPVLVPAGRTRRRSSSTWATSPAGSSTRGCRGHRHRRRRRARGGPWRDVLDAARAAPATPGELVPVLLGLAAGAGRGGVHGAEVAAAVDRRPRLGGVLRPLGAAAAAAGLSSRPLADLVADSLRWERELGLDRRTAGGGADPRPGAGPAGRGRGRAAAGPRVGARPRTRTRLSGPGQASDAAHASVQGGVAAAVGVDELRAASRPRRPGRAPARAPGRRSPPC